MTALIDTIQGPTVLENITFYTKFFCFFHLCSAGADVESPAHIRKMINKWDCTRKKVTKPKTGRSRIVRNDEVDAELLAIFSNKTLPDGDRVSISDQK